MLSISVIRIPGPLPAGMAGRDTRETTTDAEGHLNIYYSVLRLCTCSEKTPRFRQPSAFPARASDHIVYPSIQSALTKAYPSREVRSTSLRSEDNRDLEKNKHRHLELFWD